MGRYEVTWQGTHEAGGIAASGVYFVQLVAAGKSLVRRVVLVR